MNAIGIDYQRSATAVWVREEARCVPVGDGHRPRIPTAAVRPDLWGSAAVAAGGRWAGDPADPGPWPTAALAPVFWVGLRDRLFRFLGRTPPTTRHGYPTVVTGEGLADPARAARTAALAEQAGFEDARTVPAPLALLARWLAEAGGGGDRLVAAAVVCEADIEVAAFRVRTDAAGLPLVTAVGSGQTVRRAGGGWAFDRLFDQAARQLTEPPAAADRPALADAVLDFAPALGRPDAAGGVTWDGPFAGRMYAPLTLLASAVRGWPEAQAAGGLAAAVTRAAGRAADLLLLGGPGAVWPFAVAAGTSQAVWVSPTPADDLAVGAAWVPAFEHRLTGVGPAAPVPTLPPVYDAPPVVPVVADDRPPWERD